MVYRRALLLALCCFIATPIFAITRTWRGAASANWSNRLNRSPAGTPEAVDSLIFPAAAPNRVMKNDLPTRTRLRPAFFFANNSCFGRKTVFNCVFQSPSL